jgi:uncharacterized membrane protein YhaH (DUF805 family)
MDFINAVRSGFLNYANFEGRANRPMFWWWQIVPLYNIYLAVQPGDPGMNSYGPPAPPLRYDA